jgi:phenylpropionate dioxygenase-like ring-hydroxylating dioxygenase large terminal subunit
VTVLENVLDPSHLPFTHHLTISNRAAAGPLHLRLVRGGNNESGHNAAAAAAAATATATATTEATAAVSSGITAEGFAAVRWRPGKDPEPDPFTASASASGSSGVTFTAPHLVVSATQRPGSFADYNVVRALVKSSQVNTLPKAKSQTRSKQNKDMHKCSSVYSERRVPLPVLTSGGE